MGVVESHAQEPIAIVGMGCRLPGASDYESLWKMVLDRREGVTEYPGGRTPELDAFYRRLGLSAGPVSNRGGFLPEIDKFDAPFFELSPREAEWLDPQQRLLLEVTWETLEDAGIPLNVLARKKTGVFVGVWSNEYERHAAATAPVAEFFLVTGGPLYGTSSRLAFQFDLRGPDISVNAACGSSLVAVHLATRSLRSGECSVALAGGVNVIVRREITQAFSRSQMLSRDGRCKFGDAGADGFVRSDGAGMLVLKRLSDAQRDDDRVLAVIRGTAMGNDGRGSGLLATPSAAGQRQAMLDALADAGLDPMTVDLVEAHGTGTRAGDPIEISAIASVFGRSGSAMQPCRIASVKSNIGHTESAAGVASIIRTVQALRHRRFPATLHVNEPNPAIDWETVGVALELVGSAWQKQKGTPRRASVNGLGLTGTNAHVVLEEFPQAQGARTEPRNAYLLPLSASSSAALRQHAKDVAASLDALQDQEEATGALTDFCYTASLRRNHLGHRVAVAGADAPELAERLKDFARGTESAFTAAGTVTRERRPKIAFVFPGQGSQWVGMGRELLRTQSVFRSAIEEIDQAIALETGWSVLRQLEEPSSEQRLARIDVVQPTLFAMEVALARLWTSMGVVPEAVVGHSMGEVAAAHIAGILSLQDAAAIICRRSALLMRVAGAGAMAVVDLARAEAQQLLAGLEDKVSVAVCNSPRSTVLAGDPATLNEIVEGLEKQDIFCRWVRVDVASHSPQMDLLIGDLSAALADVQARAGSIPMCSTVRLAVSNGSEMSGSYWVANLRQPVLFANAIEELMRQGFDTFLEMSPHPTLVPFVEQTAAQAGRQALAVGPLRRDEPETATLLAALGQLYAAGGEVDWQRIYPSGNLVKLPAYPWQRERFWIESSGTQRFGILAETGHPLIGEAIQTAQGEWIWTARLSAEVHHWLKDHAVQGTVLLPASAYIELAGTAATMIFGGEPARVEKLRLLRAAALPPGSSCELQIVATSDSRDRYSAKFFWRESGAEWTEAAECVLLRAAQERLNQADLTLWEDLEFSQETMSGGQHAATMRGLGYDFGPSFCRIAWMAIQNESGFARIDLPGELRGERYLLHPAALDAALQLLGRILIERGERKTLLPVAIEKVEWEGLSVDGSALYARGTVHSGTLAGDVDLFDAAGRPVVAIRGLAFSPMDRASEAISELLYEIKWERLDTADNHVKTAGHWVLIADGSGMAGELGRALEIRGASIEVVQPAEILHGDIARDDAVQGVVWLTPLGFDSHSTLAEIQQLLADGAALVSKLTDSPDAFALTQICMVTRGTQTMTGEPVTNVLGAGTWGLFGSVANEYSSLRTLCADLPSVPVENEVVRLADLLLEDRKEGQIALRAKGNFGARLRSFETDAGNFQNIPAGQLRSTEQGESEGFELAQAITGSLDSFELVAAWSKPPKDEEVEIAVQAAGINFRDVLVAMGVHEALKGSRIGGECSGTVLRVGEKVVGFRPGDAVIALSPSLQKTGMFATRVTVPESLVVKKPENISFAQAAGIPCVFLTAWYALVKLARLQKGERILIHAAAGGVGLAAIQIANWIGAEIYATVGSEEKRRHLRSLGVKQIMHSRKLDFTREVLEQTNGEGVDVVLNSLAGPAIAAGLEALAPYGRFIEIGKLDLWENSKIGLQPFLRNLSLFAVDLAQAVEDRREMVGAMFTEVMNLLNDGSIAPVPTTVFPVSSAADAFQLMASGGHIGKIVLNMQDESAMIRRDKSRLAKEATYLITGGLGGLGLLTAQALAQHGARHLVLTWRHTASDEALQVIAGLKESGVTIETRQADMSADADVEALLEEIAATMPPLRGVVHAAGILDDAVVSHLSLSKFESVMAGKVGGALALDARLKDFDLDFLVYYSSVAGVLGSPGQANYAAANAMLDALAYNQRARGIPAISIDWGSWSTVGLAAAKDIRGARIASRGLKPLSPEEGVELLIEILRREPTQVTAMHLDREQWCASNPAAARSGLLANLMEKSATSARDGGDFLARLRLLDGEELRPTLTAWLREQVAAVLRLSVERVPEDKALRSLGLDSLMALELRNRMERHLRLTLSATLVWNYPTISALAAHLENRLSPTHPVETGAKADSSIGVETKSFVAEQTDSDRQSVAEMLEAELMEVESLHASSEGWR